MIVSNQQPDNVHCPTLASILAVPHTKTVLLYTYMGVHCMYAGRMLCMSTGISKETARAKGIQGWGQPNKMNDKANLTCLNNSKWLSQANSKKLSVENQKTTVAYQTDISDCEQYCLQVRANLVCGTSS